MKRAIYLSVLAVITAGCIVWRVGANTFGWSAKDDGKKEVSECMETLDAFCELSVDADMMDITIEKGKEYSIAYHTTQKNTPEYGVEDGVLTVTQKQQKIHIGITQNQSETMTITVPEGVQLKDVDITADVGDVDVRFINTENFNCTLNVGDLTAEDAELGESVIDSDVGDITLKKVQTKNLEAVSDVGDVDVSLIGKIEDYNVSLGADVGETKFNGEKVKKNSQISMPDAEYLIDVSSDVGDIDVRIN